VQESGYYRACLSDKLQDTFVIIKLKGALKDKRHRRANSFVMLLQ
jgi:hypothetical protein